MVWQHNPSFLGKRAILSIPLIGTVGFVNEMIAVDREDIVGTAAAAAAKKKKGRASGGHDGGAAKSSSSSSSSPPAASALSTKEKIIAHVSDPNAPTMVSNCEFLVTSSFLFLRCVVLKSEDPCSFFIVTLDWLFSSFFFSSVSNGYFALNVCLGGRFAVVAVFALVVVVVMVWTLMANANTNTNHHDHHKHKRRSPPQTQTPTGCVSRRHHLPKRRLAAVQSWRCLCALAARPANGAALQQQNLVKTCGGCLAS